MHRRYGRPLLLVLLAPLALAVLVLRPALQHGHIAQAAPSAPLPWSRPDFGVDVHNNSPWTWTTLPSMQAQHGPACEAPLASHENHTYDGAVFQCNGHIMTNLASIDGYGMIYLTPPAVADFTAGEVSIKFDVSTLRTSTRDFIDLWVTPFADAMTMPLEDEFPDGQGAPQRAVHLRMDNSLGGSIFRLYTVTNYALTEYGAADARAVEQIVTPSPTVRSTFELRLTRTHVWFGMPTAGVAFFNQTIADLSWTQGVLQLGHHSYNPTKHGAGTPNTWHWDNVSISAAVPFAMIKGDQRAVGYLASQGPVGSGTTITFAAPAPANAVLRFDGAGDSISLSVDRGASWQAAQMHRARIKGPENISSYWHPIPAARRRPPPLPPRRVPPQVVRRPYRPYRR